MTYINPLATALPQSFVTQQEMSAEKTRQARGLQAPPQGAGVQRDQFEHQIESPEEAARIHEEARQKRQSRERRRQHHQDEPTEEEGKPEHLDLTA